jgi:hypothetical protein
MSHCPAPDFKAVRSRSTEPDFTPIGKFASRTASKSHTRTLTKLVLKENCVLHVTHFAGAIDDDLFDSPFHFSPLAAKKAHGRGKIKPPIICLLI